MVRASGDTLAIVAVHSGAGAGDDRTVEGPSVLRRQGLESWLATHAGHVEWHDIWPDAAPPHDASLRDKTDTTVMRLHRGEQVATVARQVAVCVEQHVRAANRFLVVGGDHSIAMGTWSGVANALGANRDFGLAWFDAHLDAHLPSTTPSGNLHGMPLAVLLGHGEPRLTGISRQGPALSSARTVTVGARSFEQAERLLLDLDGVRDISPAALQRHAPSEAASAITAIVAGRSGYGMSIDLDVLEPEAAPGVGTPAPNGVSVERLSDILRVLARGPGLLGVEIVEFNPSLDRDGRTLAAIRAIVTALGI